MKYKLGKQREAVQEINLVNFNRYWEWKPEIKRAVKSLLNKNVYLVLEEQESLIDDITSNTYITLIKELRKRKFQEDREVKAFLYKTSKWNFYQFLRGGLFNRYYKGRVSVTDITMVSLSDFSNSIISDDLIKNLKTKLDRHQIYLLDKLIDGWKTIEVARNSKYSYNFWKRKLLEMRDIYSNGEYSRWRKERQLNTTKVNLV